MKIKEITKAIELSQDMINIFTDYCYTLDEYFSYQKNIELHQDLYNEYQNLADNLKYVMKKRGFDKNEF